MTRDEFVILACAAVVIAVLAGEAQSAPFVAVNVSANPMALAACDRLRPNAAAVYSLSIWNKGGWPLWRSTCYWK